MHERIDDLALVIDDLLTVDVSTLAQQQLAELLFEERKLRERLLAFEARITAQWASSGVWRLDGSRSAGLHLAREAGVGNEQASSDVKFAKRLAPMPLTQLAFEAGDLSSSHVRLLMSANSKDLEELFAESEADLITWVTQHHWADAKQLIATWISVAEDQLGKSRDEILHRRRSVVLSKTLDGVAHLNGVLEPVAGEIVGNELDRLERQLFEEDWKEACARVGEDHVTVDDLRRTVQQRRHDALQLMAQRSAGADHVGAAKPLYVVLVGSKRYENILQMSSGTTLSEATITRVLDEALIQTIVFDQDAQPFAATRQRNFTGILRRAIQIRDGHCMDPSVCDVAAEQCDLDHVDPWSTGGMTSIENGQCLCAFHNQRKGVA